MAGLEHHLDHLARSGEYRLDIAVVPVSHPTFQAVQLSLMMRPGAKADTLDAAVDQNMGNAFGTHRSSIMGMAGIRVAPGVVLVERCDDTLRILRV